MIKGVCTGSEADNQTRRLRHCHSNQPAPLNGTPLSQYQPGSSAMTKEHVSGSEAGAPALEAGTCDNRNTRLYPIIIKQIGKNHGNSQNHYKFHKDKMELLGVTVDKEGFGMEDKKVKGV